MKKLILFLGFITCYLTSFSQEMGTFKDPRDGKVYRTVKYGPQTWFAENLSYKASSGCWAYDDDESYITSQFAYGRLYNWETAKSVCPSGWHLPSDDEWKQMEKYLGMSSFDANRTGQRGFVGKELKNFSNSNNSSYFNALPNGYRNSDGFFLSSNTYAYFWTSSAFGNEDAWLRILGHTDEVDRSNMVRSTGCSVRCLKD